MPTRQFERPHFVTPHAVDRFRERVADLPAARIIELVQASLQIKRRPLYTFRMRDGRLCPVYLCMYAGVPYGAPVVHDKRHGLWPVVPTILGPNEMQLDKRRIHREPEPNRDSTRSQDYHP